MKRIIIPIILLALTFSSFAQDGKYQWPQDKKVVENLQKWQDLKFGIIIHWGIYSVPGMVESWQLTSEEWITPDTTRTYDEFKQWYWGLSKEFNPTKFNPEQWSAVAKNAGMKYVVFTSKHHDGFCLYDSKYTDYTITHSAFAENEKADALKYVLDAFRNDGFMTGCYFSKPDWHSQDYWWSAKATPDRFHNYNSEQYPERWNRYKNFVFNQVSEITKNYGPIDILWLDGGWCVAPREDIDIDRIVDEARANQPGLIVVERASGGKHENYETPEQNIPDHQINHPWESCITLTYDWGWTDHPVFKTPAKIISTLAEIVAKGGSLLLGIGPTPEGLIEDGAVEILNEIGAWMNANGEAIYSTIPTPTYTNDNKNVWFTANKDGKTLYAIIPKIEGQDFPATIEWKGNIPAKNSKMIMLSNGKKLKWSHKDGITTVCLPKVDDNGIAIKFTKE